MLCNVLEHEDRAVQVCMEGRTLAEVIAQELDPAGSGDEHGEADVGGADESRGSEVLTAIYLRVRRSSSTRGLL